MAKVERLELAPGFEISRVLTGMWQIADLERNGQVLDPDKTAQYLQPYVNAGFTTFDMADHYGSAEIIAGCYRNQVPGGSGSQLLTKWVPKPGPVTKQDVRDAVQRSLDRMQAKKLDMLQFHAWNYADPAWLDSLFWLTELRQEGLIAHLGLTNFDAAHLRVACASGIEILTNQVSYSLLDQRASGELAEVCQEYGVKILAFGTLAGGFLSGNWLGRQEPADDQLETWSQMKYKRFINTIGGWNVYQSLLGTLDKIAAKHQTTISTIVSRYMLDQPQVAGVILGARLGRSEHLAENLGIFDCVLDSDDLESIQDATQRLLPIPGDCGDEYRKPPFLTASGDLSDHLDSIPKVFDPVKTPDGRLRVFSGVSWEEFAGYCRAVRNGDRIRVSGTTASHGDHLVGGTDPAAQMHFVIDKIQAAIESLGGTLEDVERTRVFVSNIDHWEPVAKAHGQRFAHIQPVNTLVEARLVGPEYLVEVEAEACVR